MVIVIEIADVILTVTRIFVARFLLGSTILVALTRTMSVLVEPLLLIVLVFLHVLEHQANARVRAAIVLGVKRRMYQVQRHDLAGAIANQHNS